jgi:hypothetical protein
MIILPTLRYGDASYRSVSPTTLKTLEPVHQKRARLALRTFAVMPNKKRFTSTLAEIIEQDTARTAIKVIANEQDPRRIWNQTMINQTNIH